MSPSIADLQIADQITNTRRLLIRLPYSAAQAEREVLPFSPAWAEADAKLGGAVYVQLALTDGHLCNGGPVPGRQLSDDELADFERRIVSGRAAELCWAQYADGERISAVYFNTCPEIAVFNEFSYDKFMARYYFAS